MMIKKFSDFDKPEVTPIEENVMEPAQVDAGSNVQLLESFNTQYAKFNENMAKAEEFIKLLEDTSANQQDLIKRQEVENLLTSHLILVNENIEAIKSSIKGINTNDLAKVETLVDKVNSKANELTSYIDEQVSASKALAIDLDYTFNKKVSTLEGDFTQALETTDNKIDQISESLTSLTNAVEDELNTINAIVDESKQEAINLRTKVAENTEFIVKVKDQTYNKIESLYEEVKNVNKDLDALSETYNQTYAPAIERLNVFESSLNGLDDKVKHYNDELGLTKEEISRAINDINKVFIDEKYIALDNKLQQVTEMFNTLNREVLTETKEIPYQDRIHDPEERIKDTESDVDKYLTDKTFQQPKVDEVAANFNAVQAKLRFLEQAIGRIAATGPGGGEVNLRYLDDIDRSTIGEGNYLTYNATTKKFVFLPVSGGGGNGYTGSQGVQGYTGSKGDLGYTGSQGYLGYVGSKGIQGFTGSQGTQGYTGSQGVKGDTGTSVNLKGSVDSSSNLNPSYTGDIGDGYITTDTGHLWVWDGSVWIDVGNIVGPQGPQGATGYVGSRGATGYTGSVGDRGFTGSKGDLGYTGSQGVIGYTGSQGDIGYTGSRGYTGSIGYTGSQGDRYQTTSTTTQTITNNGQLTFYTVDLGLAYSHQQSVVIADGNSNHMHGTVVSYNKLTGELVVDITSKVGSGTYSSWDINLDGAVGAIGYTGSQGYTGSIGYTGSAGAGYTGSQGSPGLGGTVANWGSFYDTTTQVCAALNTPQPWALSNTAEALNVSIVNGSEITVVHGGVYNIQFSTELHNTGGGGSGTQVIIWLRKNGIDVVDTSTQIDVLPAVKYVVPAWNFVLTLNAGDNVQLMWQTDNLGIVAEAFPVSTYPAIPSVIVTVTQVTYTQQGYTGSAGAGYTGSAGNIGYTGSQGVGYTGSAGTNGVNGYTGSAGANGTIGYTGSQGSQGVIGYTGSQGVGYTGSQGTTGFTGSASTTIGYTGSQGVIGYTGSASGNQTLNTTSNVTFNNITTTGQIIETFQTYNTSITSGSTVTLNCAGGNIWNVTSSVAGNWTASLTNLSITTNQATNVTLIINQGSTPYIPNALTVNSTSVTINWQGGSAPTGNSLKKDAIAFSILQTGASTYLVFGQLVTFG